MANCSCFPKKQIVLIGSRSLPWRHSDPCEPQTKAQTNNNPVVLEQKAAWHETINNRHDNLRCFLGDLRWHWENRSGAQAAPIRLRWMPLKRHCRVFIDCWWWWWVILLMLRRIRRKEARPSKHVANPVSEYSRTRVFKYEHTPKRTRILCTHRHTSTHTYTLTDARAHTYTGVGRCMRMFGVI